MTTSEIFSLMLLSAMFGISLVAFITSWMRDHPQDPATLRRLRRERRRRYHRFWGI